jgi:hypothetical protein
VHTFAHLVEPFSVRRAGRIVSVDPSYVADVIKHYPWFSPEDVTEVQTGVEPEDFDYVRQHPRQNPIFDAHDGLLHFCYVGRGGPDMLSAARALFEAIKLGLGEAPQIFERIRLHFIGTDYAPAAVARYQFLPLAREVGVEAQVEEHPARVPYLTALQIMTDAHVLMVIGSTETYYTASKVFPYVLARKPIFGFFHEGSSATSILRGAGGGEAVTFSAEAPPMSRVPAIYAKLVELTAIAGQLREVQWDAFQSYTARAVTAQLATAFEAAICKPTI